MREPDWRDPSRFVKEIFVEESCIDLDYTKEIIARTKLPWKTVNDRQKPNDLDDNFVKNLSKGKQQLFLAKNRGHFFKPCPGTKEYRCCEYHVINTGMNCPIDCVYCILQAYLNSPWLSYYVNIDDLFRELSEVLSAHPEQMFRIGTGEFTDSLALDRITQLSKPLIEFFSKRENAVLELKTKSAVIENLQGLKPNGKTIVAWSLNGTQVMQRFEPRSASLIQRLEAAQKCAEWGYKLAFHFDPIIAYDGWQNGYKETIDTLFQWIDAAAIVWISLGALRYLPRLKEISGIRFPGTPLYCQESVIGLDGKMRYFRPFRVELYKHLVEMLKKRVDSKTCIYFCMESDEIWREVMGFAPEERGGIAAMLNASLRQ